MNKSDWSGFDKLQSRLKKLEGAHNVSLNKLFSDSFMRIYTQHATIDEFFDAGGFEFETEEEFENIPEQQLNVQVQSTTHFRSWQEMLNKAGEDWMAKELDI